MMPKTSVSPAAMRKSMTPNCKPLSVCSRTRAQLTAGRAPPPPRLPLHRALGGVGVLVALEDGLLYLHREVAVWHLHGLEQVEVLDREVIRVVRVRPARRLVVGAAHRRDHTFLVGEIAFHGADRAVDQH